MAFSGVPSRQRQQNWALIVAQKASYPFTSPIVLPERSWLTFLTTIVGDLCHASWLYQDAQFKQKLSEATTCEIAMIDAVLGVGVSEIVNLFNAEVENFSSPGLYERDWVLVQRLGKVADTMLSSHLQGGLADTYPPWKPPNAACCDKTLPKKTTSPFVWRGRP